jgi:hypothetical protein
MRPSKLMKIRTPAKKYRFMLGTTSRVPKSPGWHYLMLDIDGEMTPEAYNLIHEVRYFLQKTNSGWHVFFPIQMRLKIMLSRATELGADPVWADLALKRGWAFLADKGKTRIPWPVERMVLAWRKHVNRS